MTKLPGELLPYEKDDDVCPKIKINFEFSLACGKDAIFTHFLRHFSDVCEADVGAWTRATGEESSLDSLA